MIFANLGTSLSDTSSRVLSYSSYINVAGARPTISNPLTGKTYPNAKINTSNCL